MCWMAGEGCQRLKGIRLSQLSPVCVLRFCSALKISTMPAVSHLHCPNPHPGPISPTWTVASSLALRCLPSTRGFPSEATETPVKCCQILSFSCSEPRPLPPISSE